MAESALAAAEWLTGPPACASMAMTTLWGARKGEVERGMVVRAPLRVQWPRGYVQPLEWFTTHSRLADHTPVKAHCRQTHEKPSLTVRHASSHRGVIEPWLAVKPCQVVQPAYIDLYEPVKVGDGPHVAGKAPSPRPSVDAAQNRSKPLKTTLRAS